MYRVYRVGLEVNHKDCWTSSTSDFDVKAEVKYLFPISSKNSIFEIAEVSSDDKDELSDFITYISNRKNGRNINMMSVDRTKSSKTALLYYLKYFDNSITKVLMHYDNIITSIIASNGVENWRLYYLGDDVDLMLDGLKKSLESVDVKLVNVFYERVNANDMIGDLKRNSVLITNLTSTEKQVLYTAFKLGYFNYPKNVNLDDLAKSVGVTKVALDKVLRNGLKKILSQVFNEKSNVVENIYKNNGK